MRFALGNGLKLPDGPKIVVLESDWEVMHRATPPRSEEDLAIEAKAIGAEVGTSRSGKGADVLRCLRSRCVPAKPGDIVIVINDTSTLINEGRYEGKVLLMVFLPSDKPAEYDGRQALAVVSVKYDNDSGWVGVAYAQPLVVQPVRMPKAPAAF